MYDAVSNTDYMASNDWTVMNNAQEGMWMEVVLA
jgi:hypothetical protein